MLTFNNKNASSADFVWTVFTPYSYASVVNFERVIALLGNIISKTQALKTRSFFQI